MMNVPHQPEQVPPEAELDRAIEQEIRQGRKFSIADAIGQEAGNFLKGESPVPKLMQVRNELLVFVRVHVPDPSGALQATLQELIQTDDVVCSRCFDDPLSALITLVEPLTTEEVLLQEFVRRVDMRWGQLYGERPYFERPGQPPHPDDEYTYESVRTQLIELVALAKLQQSS
jgi:hypothetical protein